MKGIQKSTADLEEDIARDWRVQRIKYLRESFFFFFVPFIVSRLYLSRR